MMTFYKYHGAGNDFLIADGRDIDIDLSAGQIARLCERHTGIGADGVMVLERSSDADFRMRYYNSDGSGGMMCGNGGRCIVAFAADLGCESFVFEAPDGQHVAELENTVEAFSVEPRIVRLKMKDVQGAALYDNKADAMFPDVFLDTGTRHLVHFVENVGECEVVGIGSRLRYDPRFAPQGVNVNFVCVNDFLPDGNLDIDVRTYEKGVEDETLACGTGIVASSMASWIRGVLGGCGRSSGPVEVSARVHARIADLKVDFVPRLDGASCLEKSDFQGNETLPFTAEDVWLQGPAVFVAKIEVQL
ncbi:MAG: diaminopimelate epimerase [Bacteroidales bacterium]|nr:diaminopimelate epimerase [Bacteroidales bacterium]